MADHVKVLDVSEEDRQGLQSHVQARTASVRDRERARIVLLAGPGLPAVEIAACCSLLTVNGELVVLFDDDRDVIVWATVNGTDTVAATLAVAPGQDPTGPAGRFDLPCHAVIVRPEASGPARTGVQRTPPPGRHRRRRGRLRRRPT